MGEIVNLRRAKKQRDRAQAAQDADANRAKHGITKAARKQAEAEAKTRDKALDGAKLS